MKKTTSATAKTPSALLSIRAAPNAKRTACAGLMEDGETWKIRLAAPPEDGRANTELLEWLAETLQVRKQALSLVSGASSRSKRVAVEGLDAAEARARLEKACAG